jgi:L-alanine-DL-glutamate epimerase-like enolase superfamily enzyme
LSSLQLEEPPATAGATALVRLVDGLLPGSLPAARFALQTALLDRFALARGRPLWDVLRELLPEPAEPLPALPLSGLLSSTDPALALAEAERQHGLGLRCFKLKIGPGRLLPPQAALLAGLRARWGGSVKLRLDANGSLAPGELASTSAEIERFQPDFVEEPLARPELELLRTLPFDWALDESLQVLPLDRVAALSRLPRCRALVLKLTTLGGFGAAAALARCARSNGKLALLSHALDGALGWLASVHFAFALGSSAAAGLWPRADGASSELFVAGNLRLPLAPGLGPVC